MPIQRQWYVPFCTRRIKWLPEGNSNCISHKHSLWIVRNASAILFPFNSRVVATSFLSHIEQPTKWWSMIIMERRESTNREQQTIGSWVEYGTPTRNREEHQRQQQQHQHNVCNLPIELGGHVNFALRPIADHMLLLCVFHVNQIEFCWAKERWVSVVLWSFLVHLSNMKWTFGLCTLIVVTFTRVSLWRFSSHVIIGNWNNGLSCLFSLSYVRTVQFVAVAKNGMKWKPSSPVNYFSYFIFFSFCVRAAHSRCKLAEAYIVYNHHNWEIDADTAAITMQQIWRLFASPFSIPV